jgi:hypothetical protein
VLADLKEWSSITLGDLEKRSANTKKELDRCRRSEIN